MIERMRGERLQIMLSPEELTLIDDFRFAKRMPSRAATVRELFRRGLAAEGFSVAPTGQMSKDFSVDRAAGAAALKPPARRTTAVPGGVPEPRRRDGDNGRA